MVFTFELAPGWCSIRVVERFSLGFKYTYDIRGLGVEGLGFRGEQGLGFT